MGPRMKTLVTLLFMAILSSTCFAFSWSSVFGERSDVAETTAKAMEGGRVSSHIPNKKAADYEGRGSPRNGLLSAGEQSRQPSDEDLPPVVERPLPEDGTVQHDKERIAPKRSKHFVESTTVVVRGERPPGTSEENSNSLNTGSTHVVERNSFKTEVDGSDNNYSTLKKEIHDMTKQLGPEEPSLIKEELHREERKSSHHGDLLQHKTEHNVAVTEGIEQAILGLTNVYNVLRNSGNPDDVGTTHNDKVHPPASTNLNGEVERETNSTLSQEMNGPLDNLTQQKNGTDSRTDAQSERGMGDVTDKSSSGISLLALIMGVVVVGTIAFLVMGYLRNRNGVQAQQVPLYPPRGPSFV